jgi:hypothetical protein
MAEVLRDWLPASGLVLEIASGTGEHALYFAQAFPNLDWQPSDVHADALASISAWRDAAGLANLHAPFQLDSSAREWPVDRADAILCSNMAHISPWEATLGLLDGAARVLAGSGPLILYGPWLTGTVETAPSNLAFDQDLERRDPRWGLRRVEDLAEAAAARGLELAETRAMPANNMMLLLRRGGAPR